MRGKGKASGAGIGGGLATIIGALCASAGWDVPAEVLTAGASLLTAGMTWAGHYFADR